MSNMFRVSFLLVPCLLCASSVPQAGPTIGWDDFNTSVLNPYSDSDRGPYYVLDCPFLDPAKGNGLKDGQPKAEPAFADETQWTFTFEKSGDLTSRDDFKSILYTPWVVRDDHGVPIPAQLAAKYPNGKDTNGDNGDVGGVDFSFVYTPAAGHIGFGNLGNVHFLQIIRTVTVYQDEPSGTESTETRYFFDNLGNQTMPFADQVGANADLPNGAVVGGGKFFFDDPDRCEPKPYGYGDSDCNKDVNPELISIDWEAQTFVAIDQLNGTRHDVKLYGGLWWGFTYTNYDTPEPGAGFTSLAALFGLALWRRRAKRRAVSSSRREPYSMTSTRVEISSRGTRADQ